MKDYTIFRGASTGVFAFLRGKGWKKGDTRMFSTGEVNGVAEGGGEGREGVVTRISRVSRPPIGPLTASVPFFYSFKCLSRYSLSLFECCITVATIAVLLSSSFKSRGFPPTRIDLARIPSHQRRTQREVYTYLVSFRSVSFCSVSFRFVEIHSIWKRLEDNRLPNSSSNANNLKSVQKRHCESDIAKHGCTSR